VLLTHRDLLIKGLDGFGELVRVSIWLSFFKLDWLAYKQQKFVSTIPKSAQIRG
jgi:hypothetical protein